MDDFYKVAVPEPTTLLGLRLRPFSLGHLILLHRVESVFVDGGAPTYEDLAISVLICSQDWKGGCEIFNEPDLVRFMLRWHDKLTGRDKWLVKLGLRRPTVVDLESKCKEFADYLSQGMRLPCYSYDPSDSRQVELPMVQMVKCRLMKEMGFSEAELMDRSWALCLWDYVTLQALNGEVKVYKRDDIQNAQAVAESIAKAIANRNKPCQS